MINAAGRHGFRDGACPEGDVVVSLEPHTLDDVMATLELVARLAGAEERGSEVVSGLRNRLASVGRPDPTGPELMPTRRLMLVW